MLMSGSKWLIKKPNSAQLAIAVYIIFTMLSSSTGATLTKVARLFLVAVLLLSFIKHGLVITRKIRFYIVWVIAFWGYNFLNYFNAYNSSYVSAQLITLLYIIICDVMILLYLSTHTEDVFFLLKCVIWGATLKAIYVFSLNGLLVFMNSRSSDQTSANTLGFVCAFAIVFCLYFYKKEKKYWYIFLGVLNCIFLILSASRKAFLFLLIPIAVVLILRAKNPLVIIRNIVFIVIAALFAYFLLIKVDFLYTLVGNRIQTMINGFLGTGEVDASTETRLILIEEGISFFKEKPFFGYGLANFSAIFSQYHSYAFYAHNNYIELLVDCGLVGIVIYYFLHLKLVVSAIRNKNEFSELSMMMFGCLCAIIVCDYGMVSYYEVFSQLMVMVSFLTIQMWPKFVESDEEEPLEETYTSRRQYY